MSVTLYHDNEVAKATLTDPTKLARQFAHACKDRNYRAGGRLDVEFEYRWWLSGPDGMNSSWNEDDWPVIWDALVAVLNSDPAAKEAVLKMCDPYSD